MIIISSNSVIIEWFCNQLSGKFKNRLIMNGSIGSFMINIICLRQASMNKTKLEQSNNENIFFGKLLKEIWSYQQLFVYLTRNMILSLKQ